MKKVVYIESIKEKRAKLIKRKIAEHQAKIEKLRKALDRY